ncbi:MAG: DUF4249 domain-containing protein [Lentimicrobium sp.]|nr:DUF4249 domain-containing protein [Lentimicrobium sp.]
MKTKLIYISGLIACFFFMSSCENMVSDVDVPLSDPRLIVHSVISPQDEFIKVIVSKSSPLYTQSNYNWEDRFPPVTNAVVKLTEGNNSIILPYNPELKAFSISAEFFPVIPGKTYNLEVTAPGGYYATATTTIPDFEVPEIEILDIDNISDMGNIAVMVNFRFRDIPGQGQYYRVAPGFLTGDDYYNETYVYEIGLSRGENYITDKNSDGEYFTFRTSEVYTGYNSNVKIYIRLFVTGESYYNYHRSVSSFEGENPFSEPTPVYTNINGGLGLFASTIGRFIEVSP